jgi:lipopolysaccharide export system permease protein
MTTYYLQKNILQAVGRVIALILLLLVSLDLFFSLVNEMRQIGSGNYSLNDMAIVLLLSIPSRIVQMFPMSALIGTLMGLGVLASHSELIAMRAAGISIWKIVRMVLKFGLFLAALIFFLGEFIAPVCDRFAQNHKAFALSGGQALKTEQGIWMRDGNDFIHIHNMNISGRLEEIVRYRFDNDLQLQETSFAQSAEYHQNQWIMHEVETTIFYPEFLENRSAKTEIWKSDINPEVLRVSGVKYLDQLSLRGLWHTIQFRRANELEVGLYQLALWDKILRPLGILVMMFLGIPFIFGPLRHSSAGLRLISGILLGFSFHTLSASLGPFLVLYAWPAWVGAFLPIVVFLTLGAWLLRRID